MILQPIPRLHDEVLAAERHDYFLTALSYVHKDKPLLREDAECVAYLLMQTGDMSNIFHGWVRFAIWSRFLNCRLGREVLRGLKTEEDIAVLQKRFSIEYLKAYRKEVYEKAEKLGWKKRRAYLVGGDRQADRSDRSLQGMQVDWWTLLEWRRKEIVSDFRRVVDNYEQHFQKRIKRMFECYDPGKVMIHNEGWSKLSDVKLLAVLRACYEGRVDPYETLAFYDKYFACVPGPESIVMACQRAYGVERRIPAAEWRSGGSDLLRYSTIMSLKDIPELFKLLIFDGPICFCPLAVQLTAARMGVDHLYFLDSDSDVMATGNAPSLFVYSFETYVRAWLEGVSHSEGVVRYFNGCLPRVLLSR